MINISYLTLVVFIFHSVLLPASASSFLFSRSSSSRGFLHALNRNNCGFFPIPLHCSIAWTIEYDILASFRLFHFLPNQSIYGNGHYTSIWIKFGNIETSAKNTLAETFVITFFHHKEFRHPSFLQNGLFKILPLLPNYSF
jgi:hypothetical protein